MPKGRGQLAEAIAAWWRGPGQADLHALRAAMTALPIGVALVEDRPGGSPVLVVWNPAYERITGLRAGAPAPPDADAFELYDPDRETRIAPDRYPSTRAIREGVVVADVSLHLRREDGTWRVLSGSSAPVAPEGGHGPRAVVVLLDVTEGYEARREVVGQAMLADALVAHAEDAILTVGADRRILTANPAARAVFGRSPEELVGTEAALLTHPDDLARLRAAVAAVGEGGVARVQQRILYRDGTPRFAEVTLKNLLGIPGFSAWVITVRDVTTQRLLEDRARRTHRALLTLSRCNEALVRATHEQTLLEEVCQVIVEQGGYLMCWVGLLEHDVAKTLRPVAWAGHEAGYLSSIQVTWGEGELGRGPTGTAARTGQVVVGQDFERDPRLAPWREQARRRGYQSSSAIPLAVDGKIIGVLTMYAPEPEAFAAEELNFLVQLAKDVAFGMASLRHRHERTRAEEELRRSRAEFRALAARLDAVREDEKARIARDLHDDMGQLLTGLRIDLDLLEEKLSELPPSPLAGALVDRAVDASTLAARVVTAMRQAVSMLRPAALDRLGLVAALRQECREFAERTGIACKVELPDALALRPDAETALFRIAQEALTNVARHAGAAGVEVSVEGSWAEVVLRVVDDGRGLPPQGARSRGLGIVGMRERAERLGGQLEVLPNEGGGARVVARLPVQVLGVGVGGGLA